MIHLLLNQYSHSCPFDIAFYPMHTPHWPERSLTTPNHLTGGEIHVWRFNLDQDWPDETHTLNPTEQQRLSAFKVPLIARRYQHSRNYLRSILASYLHKPPASLEFVITAGGKPQLKQTALQFNLSHSQEWGLLAVSASQPVGIDLEKIRPMKHISAIARRLFPKDIQNQLLHGNEADQQLLFFTQWTAMEARQKALGRGIFESTVFQLLTHSV